MSDETIADIRVAIIELLKAAPGQRLLGAELGNRFRTRTGRTIKDYGYPTLTEFAKHYMAAEVALDQSGADTSFRLADGASPVKSLAPDAQSKGSDLRDANLLQTWKSPSSPYKLAVRRTDGEIRAISLADQPNDDEVELVPPSSEDQVAIATTFLEENIPEEHRELFRSKIHAQGALWWKEWNTLFIEHLPGVQTRWLRFRESRLLDLLDIKLKDAGLANEARAHARNTLLRSRASRPPSRNKDAQPTSPQTDISARNAQATLRHAIISAIEQLSAEDLRRIWLPAGVLYDILRPNR